MSASSMTAFVRNLFKETDDYRSLTQRIIRDRYMQHANLDDLDDDQRTLLREIVQIMVAEMVQNEESQTSNDKASEKQIHLSKIEAKPLQNSKELKSVKASADKKERKTNLEENIPKKNKKLECSEDLESDSERTSLAKKKQSKNKIVDSSNESDDGDSFVEAKDVNETAAKAQKRIITKKVTKKKDSGNSKKEDSGDSSSDSERTSSAKKNKFMNKIVDSSSESNGDSSTVAKDRSATAAKAQQRIITKTVSEKKDSDLSVTETEDSNSESEKGKSSKTKVLSRQIKKNPTKSKAVERKKKFPESSGVQSLNNKDLKPKKLKKATAKKKKSSELSDSQPSSAEERNSESDNSESSKPQKETEKKQAKTESKIVSRKRKLSNSSDVEPTSNKVMKSESSKKILDSDESSDGESLQTFKNKWSATNKASEDDVDPSTLDDLGTSRNEKDSSKNSVKTISRGKASSIDDSNSEDEEKLANVKKKSKKSSSDSDVEALKKSRKAQEKGKSKQSAHGKNPAKTPTQADEKDETVKKLERIARACGVLPCGKRYKLVFEHCRGNEERTSKLKQMLRDAGMTGTFSMKSAEALKLKREAAELLSNNVIIPEGRRRSTANPFSAISGRRRDRESSSSPPTPPARENFSRLKGIVDSEEDSD